MNWQSLGGKPTVPRRCSTCATCCTRPASPVPCIICATRCATTSSWRAELQHAEKRLKPLYAAVFRLKVNRYGYRTNSVEELAGMLCMSVSTFREKFSRIYRLSANKWLQEQRIGRIQRDMKYHYDRPLKEIAGRNGFESANRFWEFCTEQMKRSPSRLHKELYDKLCEERRKFYLGE